MEGFIGSEYVFGFQGSEVGGHRLFVVEMAGC